MKIHIEAPWSVNSALKELIELKLKKLKHFEDSLIHAEVFLKLGGDQPAPNNKQMEVMLYLPGPEISAKACCLSYEKAIAICTEKLKTQLIKRKEKRRSKHS